jgi:hypothetical protein
MRKWCSFPSCDLESWPAPGDIERYFLEPPEENWCFDIGRDSAGFSLEGLDGTDHLPPLDSGRINIRLYLQVHPILGMLLQWSKWDGRRQKGQTYLSKGDLTRQGQFVWGGQGTLHPVALFIPYAMAWKAVKEFLESDGALPTSIEWIASRDLPDETYPEPTAPRFDWKRVTSFAGVVTQGWPHPKDIEHCFLGLPGQRWFFDMGTDKATFELHGIDGTEHLEQHKDRIDIRLTLWGHPTQGVLFNWIKWGGGHDELYASKGDQARLGERVRGINGAKLPVGLFVPYEAAWKALNEFFETDGALPKSIEWIAERDLPPEFRRKHMR